MSVDPKISDMPHFIKGKGKVKLSCGCCEGRWWE